jgi:hypothetical protein
MVGKALELFGLLWKQLINLEWLDVSFAWIAKSAQAELFC